MTTYILMIVLIALACLTQHYRQQRDDLAAWIVYMHPEDFDEDQTS